MCLWGQYRGVLNVCCGQWSGYSLTGPAWCWAGQGLSPNDRPLWLSPQTFIDMEGSGFGGDLESLRVSGSCLLSPWAGGTVVASMRPSRDPGWARLVRDEVIAGPGGVGPDGLSLCRAHVASPAPRAPRVSQACLASLAALA